MHLYFSDFNTAAPRPYAVADFSRSRTESTFSFSELALSRVFSPAEAPSRAEDCMAEGSVSVP